MLVLTLTNYAPIYCALYPSLAGVAREHGYVLAIYGNLDREMDLICIPWNEQVSEPEEVVKAFTTRFKLRSVGKPNRAHHGREYWVISVGFGGCFINLSFTPRLKISEGEKHGSK